MAAAEQRHPVPASPGSCHTGRERHACPARHTLFKSSLAEGCTHAVRSQQRKLSHEWGLSAQSVPSRAVGPQGTGTVSRCH